MYDGMFGEIPDCNTGPGVGVGFGLTPGEGFGVGVICGFWLEVESKFSF